MSGPPLEGRHVMRTPLAILTVSALFIGLIGLPTGRREESRRDNVLLIVIDTLRADAIGRGITPNIDALARDGVLFEEAFAHAPMTLPAHTSIFTSLLPSESRVLTNGQAVERELPLLGQHLATRGYESLAAVSLATLWPVVSGCGVDRGFQLYDTGRRPVERGHEVLPRVTRLLDGRDESKPFFLFAHFSDPHEPYNCHGTAGHNARVYIDGEPAGSATTSEMSWWKRTLDLAPGEHSIRFTSLQPFKAREVLASSGGAPLSLNFTEGAPLKAHTTLSFAFDATEGPVELSVWLNDAPDLEEIRRRYELEVSAVDRAVGDLLRDLERRGVADDTVVILTGDHGEALGEHGQIGHVNTLYDEVLRVPLVIRTTSSRDQRALSKNSERLVTHVDLAPTILELSDVAPWNEMRGASLVSETKPRTLLAETHKPEAPRDLLCLRDERTKLIYDPAADEFSCYDLQNDPSEERDVYRARASSLGEWRRRLRAQAAEAAKGRATRRDVQGHLAALGYAGD